MTETTIVQEAECELRGLSLTLTSPYAGECLLCFVFRMLHLGCNHQLRWAKRFRELSAPRARGLEDRLGQVGGYCDCEIFANGYELGPQHWTSADPEEVSYPEPMPACHGVRRGSTRGCDLWVRMQQDW